MKLVFLTLCVKANGHGHKLSIDIGAHDRNKLIATLFHLIAVSSSLARVTCETSQFQGHKIVSCKTFQVVLMSL